MYYVPGNAPEREKIRLFLRSHIDESTASRLLSLHEHQIAYLMSRPVIDMRRNGRDTTAHLEAFDKVTDSLTKLEELVMVIYQVRCNLEHGQKSPSRERDLRLCQCAAPIVASVIETLRV